MEKHLRKFAETAKLMKKLLELNSIGPTYATTSVMGAAMAGIIGDEGMSTTLMANILLNLLQLKGIASAQFVEEVYSLMRAPVEQYCIQQKGTIH